MSFLQHNTEKLIDWLTRRKSIGAMFVSAGIGLIALTVGPGLWSLVITGTLPPGFDFWSMEFGQQPLSKIGLFSGLLFAIGTYLRCASNFGVLAPAPLISSLSGIAKVGLDRPLTGISSAHG